MPNGLKIETVDQFERLKPEERQIAIFEGIVRIEQHCKCRLETCKKNFVTKKQAKIAMTIAGAFIIGLGGFKVWPIVIKLISMI